jgi:hypothetical protein
VKSFFPTSHTKSAWGLFLQTQRQSSGSSSSPQQRRQRTAQPVLVDLASDALFASQPPLDRKHFRKPLQIAVHGPHVRGIGETVPDLPERAPFLIGKRQQDLPLAHDLFVSLPTFRHDRAPTRRSEKIKIAHHGKILRRQKNQKEFEGLK